MHNYEFIIWHWSWCKIFFKSFFIDGDNDDDDDGDNDDDSNDDGDNDDGDNYDDDCNDVVVVVYNARNRIKQFTLL